MVLYWYDIRELTENTEDEVLNTLSAADRQRIGELTLPEDRKRAVAGVLLARRALAERSGRPESAIQLFWDEEEKLCAAGTELCFSISHSGPCVVCAVAERPIGVDIEPLRRISPKMMRRSCTEEELAYVRIGDSGDERRFLEVWTAKEALFKLTGRGPLLSLSFRHPPENAVVEFTISHDCAVSAAYFT